LYKELQKEMLKQEIKILCCEVNVNNIGSVKFHKQNGFRVVKNNYQHEPGYVVDFLVKELSLKK